MRCGARQEYGVANFLVLSMLAGVSRQCAALARFSQGRLSMGAGNRAPAAMGAAAQGVLRGMCSQAAPFHELREQLCRGFENMRTTDAPFDMTVEDDLFSLNMGAQGEFRVEADPSGQLVDVFSPKSGKRTYAFDDDTKIWKDLQDGHNLLELLARDAMDMRPGYPDF